MLGHGLAADASVGVVDLEGQWIVRLLAFERDAANAGEVFTLADEGCAHGQVLVLRFRRKRV